MPRRRSKGITYGSAAAGCCKYGSAKVSGRGGPVKLTDALKEASRWSGTNCGGACWGIGGRFMTLFWGSPRRAGRWSIVGFPVDVSKHDFKYSEADMAIRIQVEEGRRCALDYRTSFRLRIWHRPDDKPRGVEVPDWTSKIFNTTRKPDMLFVFLAVFLFDVWFWFVNGWWMSCLRCQFLQETSLSILCDVYG